MWVKQIKIRAKRMWDKEKKRSCKTLTRVLVSPRKVLIFKRSEWDWHEGPGGRKNWSPTPHDPQAAHWGAGDQFFLPWANNSIWNGRRLYLLKVLGLSDLFNPEIAEFTNLFGYQQWSPPCAHSIEHPLNHTRKQKFSMIFGHFDPYKDQYLDG